MPALAVYIGALNVSILLENDDGSYDFSVFPYVYSRELFSNYCNESAFYKNLLENYLKPLKKKLSSYDVLVAGYMDPPVLDFPVKFSTTLHNILSQVQGYFPILMNNYSIITKDAFSCSMKYKFEDIFVSYKNSKSEVDYYANLGIYPQLVPNDIATQIDLDEIVIETASKECFKFKENEPLIFGGSRFAQTSAQDISKYALILNSIRNTGSYKVFMDPKNTFVLLELLKMYRQNLSINSENYLVNVGTVVSTKGVTECLVTQEAGVGQFFSLEPESIYILPVSPDSIVHVDIKNKELGSKSLNLSGGKLGLIFDTRVKKNSMSSDIKIFNNFIRQVNEVLAGELI